MRGKGVNLHLRDSSREITDSPFPIISQSYLCDLFLKVLSTESELIGWSQMCSCLDGWERGPRMTSEANRKSKSTGFVVA